LLFEEQKLGNRHKFIS